MRRSLLALPLALAPLLAPAALACGDKFLVVARGTRFQRGPDPGRKLDVLVYAPVQSPLAGRSRTAAAERALSRAGYRPVSVASSAEAAERLKGARRGLVLALAEDAPALEATIGGDALVVLDAGMGTDAVLDAVFAAARRIARGGLATSVVP